MTRHGLTGCLASRPNREGELDDLLIATAEQLWQRMIGQAQAEGESAD